MSKDREDIDKKYLEKLKEFLRTHNLKNVDDFNYIKAFTHSTYTNEYKIDKNESFDRLEFLGDSIVGKEVSYYIYNKFPDFNSGNLSLLKSNVINEKLLSTIAKLLELNKYFLLGKGENKDNPPISMFADVFESFVGAIYLAEGQETVTKFLTKNLFPYIDSYNLNELKDYKTLMQELFALKKNSNINYVTKLATNNKGEKPHFISTIMNNDEILGTGSGSSKKKAEKSAAKDAYKKIVK